MQQYELPDLNELVAFIALADTGSFSAAAAKLGRDPTVVSRRLQSLEARLGIRLAERSTRHVVVTEAGQAYLRRVRPLLEGLSEASSEMIEATQGTPHGRLRLALPASFGRMWLAPLIVQFLEAHPGIRIDAEYSNRFVDLIGEGFDAAIRLGVLTDSRLVAKKLADRRRMLCASPDYLAKRGVPTSPQDLARHACLVFTGKQNPHQWEFTAPDGGTIAVPVDGQIVCDDAEALVTAAVAGAGILYANDWLVGRELRSGSLLPILEGCPMADAGAIYLVVPSRKGLPGKTRAFCDWMTDRLGRSPPWKCL
jgi:DNA-binding transcriptional LysR family regulator